MNSSSIKPIPSIEYFRRKSLVISLGLVALFAVTMLASAVTEFRFDKAITAVPRVVRWLLANFIPDQKALEKLPNIVRKLADTVFMSVTASVSAGILALVLALAGSRTTSRHFVFSILARFVASLARNIPIVAWALVFLLTFGQSMFTGFLALFFVTFGFLTRAFMDTIDEVSSGPVEALKAAGASRGQVIFQAVIPSSLPQIQSWLLYMIETNIRSATLVGLLTGSGIGFLFDLYYKSLQYTSASLVIVCIVVVTLSIETASNALRRVIL